MAVFKKKIIQPGTYLVDRKDGSKQRVRVTGERLKKWVDNFSAMQENGLQVPAPWRHEEKSVPVRTERDEQDTDAYRNAGFWKKAWVAKDGALWGELDVPDKKDAFKVGRTVTEVSPAIHPKWVDGKDRSYEDAITHIALVTHPVVPGQDNFVTSDDQPVVALSLSGFMANEEADAALQYFSDAYSGYVGSEDISGLMPTGMDNVQGDPKDVKTAVDALRLYGLSLPDGTTPEKFVEYVTVAAQAAVHEQENQDDLLGVGTGSTRKPPKGAKEQTSPTLMSKESYSDIAKTKSEELGFEITSEQIEQVIEAHEFSAKPDAPPSPAEIAARKGELRQRVARINDAVNRGKTTPKYAEEVLQPALEGQMFSFTADGEVEENNFDRLLAAIELLPDNSIGTGSAFSKLGVHAPAGQQFSLSSAMEQAPPQDPSKAPEGVDEDLSAEQADETVSYLLESASIKSR